MDCKNIDVHTGLILSAIEGRYESIEVLMEAKADVNWKRWTCRGHTALTAAQCTDELEILLDYDGGTRVSDDRLFSERRW
jgi:hypothetical protein